MEIKDKGYTCDTSKIDALTLNKPFGVNFVFAAGGDPNALRDDLGDRRFAAVGPTWPYSEKTLRQRVQDAALKLTPPTAPPMAWIIEREGRVTMIHFEACAKRAAENGYIVTPYYSRGTK